MPLPPHEGRDEYGGHDSDHGQAENEQQVLPRRRLRLDDYVRKGGDGKAYGCGKRRKGFFMF